MLICNVTRAVSQITKATPVLYKLRIFDWDYPANPQVVYFKLCIESSMSIHQ